MLEALERLSAVAVRLLNPSLAGYESVAEVFAVVAIPVIGVDFGYSLEFVDGKQAVEEARIDQDIFEWLPRSGLVIANLAGQRQNCFMELGNALGRRAHHRRSA